MKSAAPSEVIAAAFDAYNAAAEVQRFATVAERSPKRVRDLGERLLEIGHGDASHGLERFHQALAAIPRWPFLAGKETPRDGRRPFKLTLEQLLSTRSGMGDVLARLLDLHASSVPAGGASDGGDATSAWADAMAEELATQRARFAPASSGDGDALH